MLNTFKEFWADCHKHFQKYSDPEKACVNPPFILVGRCRGCESSNVGTSVPAYLIGYSATLLGRDMRDEVERMRKLIEDMSQAQQVPPHVIPRFALDFMLRAWTPYAWKVLQIFIIKCPPRALPACQIEHQTTSPMRLPLACVVALLLGKCLGCIIVHLFDVCVSQTLPPIVLHTKPF
ncbi:gamma-aminobutyrate transaminase POP2 [Cucumis melo var. makuwa]|uniref:Gamma-aminobutyrate transaminase POP2 n=1 Tax=Cucumis melo var. makuwa TaxID=1194695 RepID=A0A5A7T371_CUCMM|nr:gamma-aminobutyrate transaminase POP2 [Cucumis melo var. makuwa]TYK13464.1 gamma-aminobutyrate transaminase POP2 [Cucumis melo var. makuwa]